MSESLPLKEIITTVNPVIKSLVDTFLTPKLEQLKNKLSLDYKRYLIPTEEHFREYFIRTYKKYSIINTLIFHNSQRLLKDIYLPLIITTNTGKSYMLDSFVPTLFNDYNKILITDTAGMGKSTIVKRLFLDIIDNSIGIPILLELRRLSKEKKLIDELREQLNSIDKPFNKELMFEFLKEGDFIFFLDGYDEISLKDRDIVTHDIQEFISKAGSNKFILTSRPENALTSFGDFQIFSIDPLKKEEAFKLLRKYDGQNNTSTLLIKKLEESELKNIDEFLTNPLLVSLLFSAFEYKQVIPFKKHIFYRQVYDANFESHDLTKGDSYIHDKHSGLSTDDFHKVLRCMGFECLKKQQIEFTKDELLYFIRKSRQFCSELKFNESDFLHDILTTVPMFTQDGVYYRWVHKSLQEYFAAQFIYIDSKGLQSKILTALFNQIDKNYNTLNLYYDIDYKTFRNVIMYDFLSSFHSLSKKIKENAPYVSFNLIKERIEMCFPNNLYLFKGPCKNGKWNDNLTKMIPSFFQEEWKSDKLHSKAYELINAEDIYSPYLDEKPNYIYLLNLLHEKKSDLFHRIKQVPNRIDFSIIQIRPDFVLINLVDENDKDEYENVNHICAYLQRKYEYTPIYNRCIEEYINMINDMNNESSENYLLDGL